MMCIQRASISPFENTAGECGAVRKSRCVPPVSAKLTLSGCRGRNSPKGVAVIRCVTDRGAASSSEIPSGKCGTVRKQRRLKSESAKSAFRKVGPVIPLISSHVSADFPNGAPLLKTRLANAEPFENPDSYRPEGPNRNCRDVGTVISIRAPQLSTAFSKEGAYPL